MGKKYRDFKHGKMEDTHQTKAKHNQKDKAEIHAKTWSHTLRYGNSLEREHLIMPVGIREGFTNDARLERKI